MRIAIAVTAGAVLLGGCQANVAQNEAAAQNEATQNEATAMVGENEPGEEVPPVPAGCLVAADNDWAAWYDETGSGPRTLKVMGRWTMSKGGYKYDLKAVPADPAQPGVQTFDLTTNGGIGIQVPVNYTAKQQVSAPNDVTAVVITCNGKGELRRITRIAHALPIGFNPDEPAEKAAGQ
jgi:hypothetical protein